MTKQNVSCFHKGCGNVIAWKGEFDMERGRYFKSKREYERQTGKTFNDNVPSISVTGSVRGMRKTQWGKYCDVVRVGNYIYKVN